MTLPHVLTITRQKKNKAQASEKRVYDDIDMLQTAQISWALKGHGTSREKIPDRIAVQCIRLNLSILYSKSRLFGENWHVRALFLVNHLRYTHEVVDCTSFITLHKPNNTVYLKS